MSRLVEGRGSVGAELLAAGNMAQLVLDALPLRLFWKDHNLTYLGCNHLFAQDAGLSRAAEIIGKSDFDLAWAEQAELYRAGDRRVMDAGKAVLNYEEPQTGPDGKKLWLRTSKIPLLGSNNEIIGVLGTYEDITPQKLTESELEKHRSYLEEMVDERTKDLRQAQRNLVDASRRAGMAEVATNVLHNVGNVLNSVNVAAGLTQERLQERAYDGFRRAFALLNDNMGDLATFFGDGGKGRQLVSYLEKNTDRLEEERAKLLEYITDITAGLEHIKGIIQVQQDYAKLGGVTEACDVAELIEDAVRINAAGLERHGVALTYNLPTLPTCVLERQKVLQIIVNLISNAKYALSESDLEEKLVTLQASMLDADTLQIVVTDNGIGIPAENLTRIFQHGFTTRPDGHGFGLHGAANTARELGGNLAVHSDGHGRGATFTLTVAVGRRDGQRVAR